MAQCVQGGEPGDRQRRCFGIADRIRQHGDRMGATIDPLGPSSRRQNADHPRPGAGAAPVCRRSLDHTREVPARTPARLGLLHRAARLAAIERDRGDSHRYLVAIGIAQLDRFDRQPSGCSRINGNGTDLSRHTTLLPIAFRLKDRRSAKCGPRAVNDRGVPSALAGELRRPVSPVPARFHRRTTTLCPILPTLTLSGQRGWQFTSFRLKGNSCSTTPPPASIVSIAADAPVDRDGIEGIAVTRSVEEPRRRVVGLAEILSRR